MSMPRFEIIRVSTDSSGGQSSSNSYWPTSNSPHITFDGRYVVFQSWDSNLVAGDASGVWDTFVKDLFTGVVTKVGSSSSAPQITPDGRFVLFDSWDEGLVADDTNALPDVFVKDIISGTIFRASTDYSGVQGDGSSGYGSLSADGLYVAFTSDATNLVFADTNNAKDAFVKDLTTGVVIRISTDSSGSQGNGASYSPKLTADGRFAVFSSDASNLVIGDTNNAKDAFVKDLTTGAVTLVSTDSGEVQGNAWSAATAITPDGRYVVFTSAASNLVPGDTNGAQDVFVKDLTTGAVTLVSTDSGGVQGNAWSDAAAITSDGRYVVFLSAASNLVPGDTNGAQDVFVKDLPTGALVRVNTDGGGGQANDYSAQPDITADGRYIVFTSLASNLVPADTNQATDIFRVTNPLLPAPQVGTTGNDELIGSTGNDYLWGGEGNDIIDGGIGIDTAGFSARLRDYIVTANTDGSYRVSSSADGLDTISGVEQLQFSDQQIDLATFTGLNGGDSVFRFYNLVTGTHFYTADTSEAENVMATLPEYLFEGVAFDRNTAGGADAIDVYRFYNLATHAHFYTADPDEVAQVLATLPQYLFEGVAYQAHSTDSVDTTELYRFYNNATNTHFYTADAQEAENVKVELAGQYIYEGVAYYVDLA